MPPNPLSSPNPQNERLANAQAMKVELVILSLAECLGIGNFAIGAFTWGVMIGAAKVLALNWPPGDPDGLISAYDEMLDTVRSELAQVFSERPDVQALGNSNGDDVSAH